MRMNISPAVRREVARRLGKVIDPELGVNIVDLGLIYNIVEDDDRVLIEYTTTTPACPMRRFIEQQMEKVLVSVEGIDSFELRLVWQPEWSVEMIDGEVEFFAHPPPERQMDAS